MKTDLVAFEQYLATCYDLDSDEAQPVVAALRVALVKHAIVQHPKKYFLGAKVIVLPNPVNHVLKKSRVSGRR